MSMIKTKILVQQEGHTLSSFQKEVDKYLADLKGKIIRILYNTTSNNNYIIHSVAVIYNHMNIREEKDNHKEE